jgi:DMSO/TMAO reductase YedYZ molybdopterin-dependent catalytic subunit
MTKGSGELSRRDFCRLAAFAGPASFVSACGWDGGSVIEPRLRSFSRVNDWVGEKILQSRSRLAREYPRATRTAMENFPSYSISFNQTGAFPSPDAGKKWALNVGGLVRKPLRFSLPAIQKLPSTTYTVKHYCVEGWTAIASWSGVPLSTIIAMVEPSAQARYLRFDSFDSGYSNGWDMESAMHPQTILAYAYNDRPLMMNHGAPLRLYSPIKLGYKLTKYLTGITFTSSRPGGYWEDQGYPWFGGI